MNANQTKKNEPTTFPLILLSSDNLRTLAGLSQALLDEGFAVQLASGYRDMEELWHQHRSSTVPSDPLVLLEVSGPHSVEEAVDTALRLKQHDSRQFVGYLADPALHASGLAGDAVFPRSPEKLASALKLHLSTPNP